jgi:hypothetical protein
MAKAKARLSLRPCFKKSSAFFERAQIDHPFILRIVPVWHDPELRPSHATELTQKDMHDVNSHFTAP